ncbi:MAG: inositol monophosphatase [Candidatus Paceibacteria bacterium]
MKRKRVAVKAAKEAGNYLEQQFNKDGVNIDKKDEGSFNLITESDKESEQIIVDTIRESYPDHSIVKEESDRIGGTSGYSWYIDPIDGTTNFAQKIPHFCISIALYKKDKPILGLVFNPVSDEMFYADTEDQQAYLNNKEIKVSTKSKLSESIIATGFPYDRSGKLSMKNIDMMRSFLKQDVGGIRRMGAAALDFCYLAAGRIDGYWEYNLSPWDYAAGAIILQQAGGNITDPGGNDYDISQKDVVTSNDNIHSTMLEVIK